jgi:hypothetical protein
MRNAFVLLRKQATITRLPGWIRLKSACEQARQVCPELLKNVAPDESQKTWAEALLCLEAINEALAIPKHR